MSGATSAAPPAAATGIALGAELLIYQVGELKHELTSQLVHTPAGMPLSLDCRQLCEIDGAGVQLLMSLAQQLHRLGARLQLLGLSEQLVQRLGTLGLADQFDITAQEAA